MPDVFDQIHAAATGDIFDQIHAQSGGDIPPQEQPQGSAVSRFVSSAASALNPMPIVRTLSQPFGIVKAAMGAAASQAGQTVQAAQDLQKGRYTEAAGHTLAAATPVVGPMAAQAGQQIGGTEAQYDKYGNIIRPGMAPDVAGGLGTAAATLAPMVAGEAVKASGVGDKVAPALQSSAERQYSRVMGPTTRPNKVKTSQVVGGYNAQAPEIGQGATAPVPGLIDRGVTAMTRKGLQQKFHDSVNDLGQQLEAEWGNLSPDQGVPTNQVMSKLEENSQAKFATRNPATGEITATGPDMQRGMDFTSELKDYLKAHEVRGPRGQMVIPYESLRKFRQDWENVAAAANGYAGADLTTNTKAAAYKASADGIRDLLNQANPDISAINREFTFWKKAADVMDATLQRTQSQAPALGRKIMRSAGAATGFAKAGPKGAALGMAVMDELEALTTSPAWQTVSAVTKDRLAKAVANGDGATVKTLSSGILAGSAANPSRYDQLGDYYSRRADRERQSQ